MTHSFPTRSSADLHLGVEQPDRVALRIVRTEAVRADQFGEAVGLVRGCHLARAAHLGEADLPARFGKLPRGFRPGETAADDMNAVGTHGLEIGRASCRERVCKSG